MYKYKVWKITDLDKILKYYSVDKENKERDYTVLGNLDYLKGYLADIKVKTIIEEDEYIDHDFMIDFSNYYVRCFENYSKKCKRLHLFKNELEQDEFKNLLVKKENNFNCLIDNYLGFIVIKPLPATIIGRTCLATYCEDLQDNNTQRFFPIKRKYEANLFGIPLEVKSLAFQEQDTVVAACATSALWSLFHGTCVLFQHPIPSPVEITQAAILHMPLETRAFPNEGLTDVHIAQAIRDIGLEPCFIESDSKNYNWEIILKGNIYSYLKAKIPVMMGVLLYNTESKEELGLHAITISGYSLDYNLQPSELFLKSSQMTKIYAHDDQIGPFCRMEFKKNVNNLVPEEYEFYLNTSWDDGNTVAIPTDITISLYHKIRIPFDVIYSAIKYIGNYIDNWIRDEHKPYMLEWDIYLTSVNDLKEDLLKSDDIPEDKLHYLLTKNMPRFIWRATALDNKIKKLDFLFDATDIEQGSIIFEIIAYDEIFLTLFKMLAQKIKLTDIDLIEARKIFSWIANH